MVAATLMKTAMINLDKTERNSNGGGGGGAGRNTGLGTFQVVRV